MKHTKETRTHFDAMYAAQEFFRNLAETKQGDFDNKSERWQESERGEAAQEDIGNLEDIADSLDNIVDVLDNLFPAED